MNKIFLFLIIVLCAIAQLCYGLKPVTYDPPNTHPSIYQIRNIFLNKINFFTRNWMVHRCIVWTFWYLQAIQIIAIQWKRIRHFVLAKNIRIKMRANWWNVKQILVLNELGKLFIGKYIVSLSWWLIESNFFFKVVTIADQWKVVKNRKLIRQKIIQIVVQKLNAVPSK